MLKPACSVFVLIWILFALPAFADTAGSGDADLKLIASRLRQMAIEMDANYGIITRRGEEPLKLAQTLGDDGRWDDVDYIDSQAGTWDAMWHLARCLKMAQAWRDPQNPLCGSEVLYQAIFKALDAWVEGGFTHRNWWFNQIGKPRLCGAILILMEPDIPAGKRQSYIDLIRYKPHGTGANLVWLASCGVFRGCLENDPDMVAESFRLIEKEIYIAGAGKEGIRTDRSFHQHSTQLYSGGYGADFTADTMTFAYLAGGTRFEFAPEKMDVLSSFILEGQQWMIHDNLFDYSVMGREITRKHVTVHVYHGWTPGLSIAAAARWLAQMPGPRQAEFEAFASRLNQPEKARPLTGNRHYWCSDFMVHRRGDYYSSVRMFSKRTLNSEAVNSEGKLSHHLSDGCHYIYVNGDEYEDIFPVWDWKRIPGTTVDYSRLPLESAGVRERGRTEFVGGVSDGRYGAAAFNLLRKPAAPELARADDEKLKKSTLTARKSWFSFDNEIVCLGTDISSDSGNPVLTSVNQCRLRGDVVSGDGSGKAGQAVTASSKKLKGSAWVHHNRIGYIFPEADNVSLSRKKQAGSWYAINQTYSKEPVSGDVFSLWIDHGRDVKDGRYGYIVVPAVDADAAAAYAKAPEVSILSNTSAMQAAAGTSSDGERLVQCVFWQAGTLRFGDSEPVTIGVDKPCLLLARVGEDAVQMAVSNPLNTPLELTVEINLPLEGEGVRLVEGQVSRIKLTLPDGEQAGSSLLKQWRIRR